MIHTPCPLRPWSLTHRELRLRSSEPSLVTQHTSKSAGDLAYISWNFAPGPCHWSGHGTSSPDIRAPGLSSSVFHVQVHVRESFVDRVDLLMDYKGFRIPTACSRCYQHDQFIWEARLRDLCAYIDLCVKCDQQCGRLRWMEVSLWFSIPSRRRIRGATYLSDRDNKPFDNHAVSRTFARASQYLIYSYTSTD